jgi:hypothetical protein
MITTIDPSRRQGVSGLVVPPSSPTGQRPRSNHCAGASIARLEIAALIKALIPRVERFEIISQERADLVSLRGLKHLQIRIS